MQLPPLEGLNREKSLLYRVHRYDAKGIKKYATTTI